MDRRCIAVLLVAALAAGAEGPPQDWEYSVTRDGRPAAGVRVGLMEIPSGFSGASQSVPTRFATTDAKGEFRLPHVDRGGKAIARVLARDRNWLVALALADPDRAVRLVDRMFERASAGRGGPIDGVLELARVLTAPDGVQTSTASGCLSCAGRS